ncbi:MAG: hypothetical protein WEB58_08005 [Planctomycetaceae bacterium]
MKTIRTAGTVHGNSIELPANLGLADGQEVEVIVRVSSQTPAVWGEGLRRCAGALAETWSDEDDRILEEIARDRKVERPAEIEE